MRSAIIALMADLYFDEPRSRAVLIGIGLRPAQIPDFRSAETFWPSVVIQLENGIIPEGVGGLLEAAARDHPGNERLRHLLGDRGPAPAPRGRLRVLCLLADPGSTLRLDKEARLFQEIEERGGIEPRIRHAVRITDITRAILDNKPQILHFAGHGGQNGQLVFEGNGDTPAVTGAEQLAGAIAATVDILDCVVLNSCYTADNANAFRGVTRAVAGSVAAIEDECALAFARGFYTAIAAGEPVAGAYATGCADMELEGCLAGDMHFVPFSADRRR